MKRKTERAPAQVSKCETKKGGAKTKEKKKNHGREPQQTPQVSQSAYYCPIETPGDTLYCPIETVPISSEGLPGFSFSRLTFFLKNDKLR